MSNNRIYHLSINVSYAQCERIYRQGGDTVIVSTLEGVRVQLPSKNLRQFIGPDGIHGQFILVINAQNKIIELKRQ